MNNQEKLHHALANDPWYDPDNTQLDLSGLPSFNLQPEEDFYDDRFSQRDMTAGYTSRDLKSFLNGPIDNATSQELARTGQQEFIDDWNDRKAEEIALQFMKAHPDYYATNANCQALIRTLCESASLPLDTEVPQLVARDIWTLENLESAFETLKVEGQVQAAPGTIRHLSASELQSLAALCAVGNGHQAVEEYVALSLGQPRTYFHSISEHREKKLISDPALRPLFERAVYFVFSNVTLDYGPSREFEEFLGSVVGGRFPTVALYQTAWGQWKEKQKHSFLFSSDSGNTQRDDGTVDFDNLTDAEIASLHRQTLKEYFRQNRG